MPGDTDENGRDKLSRHKCRGHGAPDEIDPRAGDSGTLPPCQWKEHVAKQILCEKPVVAGLLGENRQWLLVPGAPFPGRRRGDSLSRRPKARKIVAAKIRPGRRLIRRAQGGKKLHHNRPELQKRSRKLISATHSADVPILAGKQDHALVAKSVEETE